MMWQAAAVRAANTPAALPAILPAIAIYGALAVALVWLGIGSIMARRWARALLLIFSWIWLIMGVVALFFTSFFMPQMLANMSAGGTSGGSGLPSTAMRMMMIVVFMVISVFFVILPAVWAFFYNSRHVKATCETRDPVTRWTDACPLPVLGLSVVMMVSAPMTLLMPVMGHAVMPFFGMFLTGIPGALFCLALAALWGYAGWSLYKLEQRGWWLALIALCLIMVSSLVTFAGHDMMEMYRLMDYPEAQLEQIQKSGLLMGSHMLWMMSLSMLPFLGYLLFLRRYLRRP